jgi:hypothetical protein
MTHLSRCPLLMTKEDPSFETSRFYTLYSYIFYNFIIKPRRWTYSKRQLVLRIVYHRQNLLEFKKINISLNLIVVQIVKKFRAFFLKLKAHFGRNKPPLDPTLRQTDAGLRSFGI